VFQGVCHLGCDGYLGASQRVSMRGCMICRTVMKYSIIDFMLTLLFPFFSAGMSSVL
jgi:hypothetical protein